jgi:hypothetical protein
MAYDAVATIYEAEVLMRSQHRIIDSEWKFWGEVADWLNSEASRGLTGDVRSQRDVRMFNRAHSAAAAYLEAFGPPEPE